MEIADQHIECVKLYTFLMVEDLKFYSSVFSKVFTDSLNDEELKLYAKETIQDDGKKWIVCDTDLREELTKWKKKKAWPRTE